MNHGKTDEDELPNHNDTVAPDMELQHLLLHCMAENLTALQYKVFVLSFLEGMSQKSIAEEFNVSESTISRHFCVAKQKMRRALGYEFNWNEPDSRVVSGDLADTYGDMRGIPLPHPISIPVPHTWV